MSAMAHGHIDGAQIALEKSALGWRNVFVGLNKALKPLVAIPAALLVVAEVIVDTLRAMNLHYPVPDRAGRLAMAAARKALQSEK